MPVRKDWFSMKKDELIAAVKERGMAFSGKRKDELIAMLTSSSTTTRPKHPQPVFKTTARTSSAAASGYINSYSNASSSIAGMFKKDELLDIAAQYGVIVQSRDTKDQIVQKLLAAGVDLGFCSAGGSAYPAQLQQQQQQQSISPYYSQYGGGAPPPMMPMMPQMGGYHHNNINMQQSYMPMSSYMPNGPADDDDDDDDVETAAHMRGMTVDELCELFEQHNMHREAVNLEKLMVSATDRMAQKREAQQLNAYSSTMKRSVMRMGGNM
jgi:hypothetical protein